MRVVHRHFRTCRELSRSCLLHGLFTVYVYFMYQVRGVGLLERGREGELRADHHPREGHVYRHHVCRLHLRHQELFSSFRMLNARYLERICPKQFVSFDRRDFIYCLRLLSHLPEANCVVCPKECNYVICPKGLYHL